MNRSSYVTSHQIVYHNLKGWHRNIDYTDLKIPKEQQIEFPTCTKLVGDSTKQNSTQELLLKNLLMKLRQNVASRNMLCVINNLNMKVTC